MIRVVKTWYFWIILGVVLFTSWAIVSSLEHVHAVFPTTDPWDVVTFVGSSAIAFIGLVLTFLITALLQQSKKNYKIQADNLDQQKTNFQEQKTGHSDNVIKFERIFDKLSEVFTSIEKNTQNDAILKARHIRLEKKMEKWDGSIQEKVKDHETRITKLEKKTP